MSLHCCRGAPRCVSGAGGGDVTAETQRAGRWRWFTARTCGCRVLNENYIQEAPAGPAAFTRKATKLLTRDTPAEVPRLPPLKYLPRLCHGGRGAEFFTAQSYTSCLRVSCLVMRSWRSHRACLCASLSPYYLLCQTKLSLFTSCYVTAAIKASGNLNKPQVNISFRFKIRSGLECYIIFHHWLIGFGVWRSHYLHCLVMWNKLLIYIVLRFL